MDFKNFANYLHPVGLVCLCANVYFTVLCEIEHGINYTDNDLLKKLINIYNLDIGVRRRST